MTRETCWKQNTQRRQLRIDRCCGAGGVVSHVLEDLEKLQFLLPLMFLPDPPNALTRMFAGRIRSEIFTLISSAPCDTIRYSPE